MPWQHNDLGTTSSISNIAGCNGEATALASCHQAIRPPLCVVLWVLLHGWPGESFVLQPPLPIEPPCFRHLSKSPRGTVKGRCTPALSGTEGTKQRPVSLAPQPGMCMVILFHSQRVIGRPLGGTDPANPCTNQLSPAASNTRPAPTQSPVCLPACLPRFHKLSSPALNRPDPPYPTLHKHAWTHAHTHPHPHRHTKTHTHRKRTHAPALSCLPPPCQT